MGHHSGRLLARLCLAALLLGLSCALARAAEAPSQTPPSPLTLAAVMVESPPTLDGLLDDPCWSQATHIEAFWREKVDAPELEPTEAWLCYDRTAVYVAFRCHDSKPGEIRANQKKRQGSMWNDDRAEVFLDVENAGRNLYSFRVNPAGTQYDEVPGGTSEKIEWKGDWHAAARVDDAGWNAEFALPFSILRYPNGQDCFRVMLGRSLARQEDFSSWPLEFARRQDLELCARWTGLVTPPVPFRYILMPYALSVTSEAEADREPLTGGLDLKGTLPNSIVALATYHPDFRNLEDVVETIDFTFVERYLPEYRPFFQEGAGYLPSGTLFYSRRIGDLDFGAKAFGTLGPHRFGILDVFRRGGENHLAWAYDHRFNPRTTLGLAGVDRNVPDQPDNQAYTLDANWNYPMPGGGRWFGADYSRSHTAGEGGDDAAFGLRAGAWRLQGLAWDVNYRAVQPEFRADDGYVPETGVREYGLHLHDTRTYETGRTQGREWWLNLDAGDAEGGPRRGLWLGHDYLWRNGITMWTGTSQGERDGFAVVDYYLGGLWNRNDMYHKGSADHMWGQRYGQPYRYQRLRQTFHPSRRWSVELRAERSYAPDLDDDGNVLPPAWSRQLVLTTTCDISEERSASARLVRRASTTNYYAAYRQRVRRGMDLLVVAGDPNADSWVSRLAVKAIWCF